LTYVCVFLSPCFFFFQAEDGIRDFHVTGVQTCALPIYGKGADFSSLREPVARHCRAVVLLGRDADLIAEALGEAVRQVRVATLDEAVQRCAELAEPGDAVLLSPACASLDMFRNFEERGRLFAAAVEALPA